MFHCSVIKDRFFALLFVTSSFAIISCRFLLVKKFFQLFLKLFLFLSCSNSDMLSHPIGCCQELFLFLFDSFVISVRSLRRNSDRIPPLAGFVNNFLNFSYNLFIRVIYHISDSYSYRRNRPAGRFPYFLPVCFFYTIYNTVY